MKKPIWKRHSFFYNTNENTYKTLSIESMEENNAILSDVTLIYSISYLCINSFIDEIALKSIYLQPIYCILWKC